MKKTPKKPCKCGSREFWHKMTRVQDTNMTSHMKIGPWVCSVCHKPPVDACGFLTVTGRGGPKALTSRGWLKVNEQRVK